MRYDELQDEIKNAMRAKDKPKLSILRQVHGEIKNIEVNERRDITDADVDAMLKRLIKQTKETVDGSIKAGNDQERTDTLTAQVAILESYLPKQVSGDELAAPVLLGLGLDEFSMSASSILRTRKMIRSLSKQEMEVMAEKALQCGNIKEVTELVKNSLK